MMLIMLVYMCVYMRSLHMTELISVCGYSCSRLCLATIVQSWEEQE